MLWADLSDDELRTRLSSRLRDSETFVDWLVQQRDNDRVSPRIDAVLDD